MCLCAMTTLTGPDPDSLKRLAELKKVMKSRDAFDPKKVKKERARLDLTADADDAPLEEAYVTKSEKARLVNSGRYSGMPWAEGFAAFPNGM